jgi:hypothetical protein
MSYPRPPSAPETGHFDDSSSDEETKQSNYRRRLQAAIQAHHPHMPLDERDDIMGRLSQVVKVCSLLCFTD